MNKKVVIIGSGCAGLTSAIYLSRANIDTTVFTGCSYGALEMTPLIENFPGFPNGISGFDLIDNMVQQAVEHNVNFIEETIVSIDPIKNSVLSDCGVSYDYDVLIIATGTKLRSIPLKNAKNVYHCAICDGSLYKNKDVCVIGGGNTALTEALYLSNICKSVTIIIRRDVFRAEQYLIDKINTTSNIKIIKNNQVVECVGDAELEYVILSDNTKIYVNAIFVAIGSDKNDELLTNALGENYCLPNNIKMCGDVVEDRHQAIIAASSGAKTALDIIDDFNMKGNN